MKKKKKKYCGRRHAKRERPAVDEEEEEVFFIGLIGEQSSKAVVTLQIGRPNKHSRVEFQMDPGAECNVIPKKQYIQATGDHQMKRVDSCTNKFIKTYTGERYPIMGSVTLPIWRNGKEDELSFNITQHDFIPLLSLKTCVKLGLLTINHGDTPVNKVNANELLSEYSDVFGGLGELPGEYHIVTDDTVKPAIHPPRRVPVPLREKVQAKLDEMVQRNIITPVKKPTTWVSSMLVVVKPDKLRICIDPRDLNRAIRREHYQIPTIEEIATRLTNAKKFTVFDAKEGFWQKRLDEESSYKTTFNTPFGRFRWTRMPFGISSAPEVWQRTMHEFVDDLDGVEVIADDFLIAGFGATDQEVTQCIEVNERAFLDKCRSWNLKLNRSKVKRDQTSVRFMGHILTAEGFKPDPAKVAAILEMPEPNDVTALKRFLGMVNYLSKYLPRLAEVTEPLRKLDNKDVEFDWTTSHMSVMATPYKNRPTVYHSIPFNTVQYRSIPLKTSTVNLLVSMVL